MTAAQPAGDGRYVGQRVHRAEDLRLTTGRGCYVDDVAPPDLLHAAFVRSPVARGNVRRLDVEAAAALPGVFAVFTAEDLPARDRMAALDQRQAPGHRAPARSLATGDVRYVGEPVAVVVAVDRYVAEDACALVELDIAPGPPVLDQSAAVAGDAPLVHPELETNVAVESERGDPDAVEAAFAEAAHLVTRTFTESRVTQVPMEPRGIVAAYDPVTTRLEVWASTQGIHLVRQTLARMLDLHETDVVVHAGDVGGAFGQKIYVHRDEACVVLAAVALGRPVKWIEDRQENLTAAAAARGTRADVQMAVDEDGRILAACATFHEDVGAFPLGGAAPNAPKAAWMFPGPYRIPSVSTRSVSTFSNTCGRGSYRGPWSIETVAREQMMDHVAREIGLDPLEFRRRNVLQPSDLPHETGTGHRYDDISPAATLEDAVAIAGYDVLRDPHVDSTSLRGVGISLFIEPSGAGRGRFASEQAIVRMGPSGRVDVAMGLGDQGQSLRTTIPQIVADALGCRLDAVRLHINTTDTTPYGGGAAGSRNAVIGGAAATTAAQTLRSKILRIGAHLLECAEDDLVLRDGALHVTGSPDIALSLAEVARTAYEAPEQLPPGETPGLEAIYRHRHAESPTWSNACHVCVCRIDRGTGAVTIERFVVSEDCGIMINPTVVEGQIAGGVAQGIGQAILEHMSYDDAGNPTASTFLDYRIPTSTEVPDLQYGHIETPSTEPGGFKGMGEGGAIGAPAAVVNAINDALRSDQPIRHLPVTPADIVARLP